MNPARNATPDINQLAETYFAAWRDHDPDRIVALHTPDTQFQMHVGTPAAIGRDAVRDAFAQYFEQYPNFAFDVHRVVFGPTHWVLDWTACFTRTRQIDGHAVSELVRVDCLDLVVISPEGLVERKDTFVDFAHAAASVAQ